MGLSQRRSDESDGSLSHAVVEAVADREGVDVTELEPPAFEPLYSVVDPDALDAVFAPTHDGGQRATGSVTFEYEGYTVTVDSDGTVDLE